MEYQSILRTGKHDFLLRDKTMKRVITYGTFDLLHYGHINLLKRARALGDYLVVAISTDEFNKKMKNKVCIQTYEERKTILENLRCVDLVIPETSWEQKSHDVVLYEIDTFCMGSDWQGKFDFLKEYCDVVYLSRTEGISTTMRKGQIVQIFHPEKHEKAGQKHENIVPQAGNDGGGQVFEIIDYFPISTQQNDCVSPYLLQNRCERSRSSPCALAG